MPGALIRRIHDECAEGRGDRRAKLRGASLVAEAPIRVREHVATYLIGLVAENARIHRDVAAQRAKCAGTAENPDTRGSAKARDAGPGPSSAVHLLRLK